MEAHEPLSEADRARYARQIALPGFGEEGQRQLLRSSALVVGLGGLGSPAALYLAAAGVGTIGLVEPDTVELSNLQRQILYSTAEQGRPKIEAAAERLSALNPGVRIARHVERLDGSNADRLIEAYDVVVACPDNFATRLAVNDACVRLRKPDVYGAVLGFEGQASVFPAGGKPCYRCLVHAPTPPPPNPRTPPAPAAILGAVASVIGAIQATEALKILLGLGGTLAGRLLAYDARAMKFRTLTLAPDPKCPVCGEG